MQVAGPDLAVASVSEFLDGYGVGVLSPALDPTDRRLGNAKQHGGLRHAEVSLLAPLPEIHGANIRDENNTSTVFYTSGGVARGTGLAHPWAMGKKRKKKRPHFIRPWRKFRHLTQQQLAERLDITQATLSRIEKGEIAYTQPVLEAIADALACEPGDLIMRDPHLPSAWAPLEGVPDADKPRVLQIIQAFKSGTHG